MLAVATARAQEPLLLRLPLLAGQEQAYCQGTDLRLRMDIAGKEVATAMNFEVTMDLRVVAVKDGRADVDQTVRRLRLRLQNPRLQVDYDSDQPDAPGGNVPALGAIAQLTGKTFRMTIDGRGRVSDVKLPGGVEAALGEALGGGEPWRFFAQNLPHLPERPLPPGGSWECRTTLLLSQVGNVEVKVRNRVTQVTGSKVEIAETLQPDTDRLELPRDTTLTVQKAEGSTVLDLATGSVVSSEIRLQMRLKGPQAGFATVSELDLRLHRRALETRAPKSEPSPGSDQQGGG
jgi:hypothetical protein